MGGWHRRVFRWGDRYVLQFTIIILVDLGSGDVWSLWFTLDLCVHMVDRFFSLANFLHEKNETGLYLQ